MSKVKYGAASYKKRRSVSKYKKEKKHPLLRALRAFFAVLLISGTILAVICLITFAAFIREAPDISSITNMPASSATYIYNAQGARVRKLTLPESNRDLVSISSVPQDLQHAFVAIEDSRFYKHDGIDPIGIFRAIVSGISQGHFSEGASTITQQLLKNMVFNSWTSEQTFAQRLRRKVQEQYLALRLEKVMSKDQILEDYLNIINLGAGCYGVQSASYCYFGKDVSELTLSECAVIAAITQNPSRYNPITHPEENALRRKAVLDAMLKQDYIGQADYDAALMDNVYVRIQSNDQSKQDSQVSVYSYYEDALIAQVLEDLQNELNYTYKQACKAVYSGGLRIYSAQDANVQKICDEEFENAANFPSETLYGLDYALSIQRQSGEIIDYGSNDLMKYIASTFDPSSDLMYDTPELARADAQRFKDASVLSTDTVLGERITITPQPQASVVVIDQKTGYVHAVIGGRGKKEASLTLNRATYTTRQPGSTFKILTAYAPALDTGAMTLATRFDNTPLSYTDGTSVNNWDINDYGGQVSMREAIVRSVNVAAVRCITSITPQTGYDYARSFGISTLTDGSTDPSLTDVTQALALGGTTYGVTNLDLCGAYACIANQGMYIRPTFYTRVEDTAGNILLDHRSAAGSPVIRPSTASLLTSAMEDVISDPSGTANGYINLGDMAAAGKSGTTSDYRDIWFVGFTPYYTCSVWGGYDNNDTLPSEGIGHSYSKVLWNSIMTRLNANMPPMSFTVSQDIVRVPVCTVSGDAASSGCPSVSELFASANTPSRYCSLHGGGGTVTPGIAGPAPGQWNQNSLPAQNNTPGTYPAAGDIIIYSTDQTVLYSEGSAAG